ncbi:MAG: VWA domain-containing protein [Sphaerochaetaceae bacterium]|nr:VWA domain-containing protein [Sphaerochaetaceae bacterium]
MKNSRTELVFILDMSGSMSDLVSDTIGGFNSMIQKQKKEEGECLVSVVLFNQDQNVLFDRVKIEEISEMTDKHYCPSGTTALIDALGRAIHHIGNVHKYARQEDRPDHTVFIITTDGMENSSRFYQADRVRSMVERQKNNYSWEFLFLGANIDAVETARRYGIDVNKSVRYHNDAKGVAMNYRVMERAIRMVRSDMVLDSGWKEDAEDDFEKRKK